MKLGVCLAAGLLLLSPCLGRAQSQLSEQQARTKAINILKGDPYGKTPAQVMKNIKQVQFARDGKTKACGAKNRPVWEFHVVATSGEQHIDGYLALDAVTGRLLCTNLPLLD
jgi:hypothetical protein